MNYYCLFALVVLALLVSADVDPGFRTTVSNGGLEYAKSVLQPILVEKIKTVTIPDLEDTVKTPVGKTKISVTNIHLNDFSLQNTAIVLTAPNVGTVSIDGIALNLNFDWRYKAKFASDHGSGDASSSGASTKISAAISKDDKGAPVVTLTDTGFDCGDLDIKLHGGASWLYNFIINMFKSVVHNEVNSVVRSKMREIIQGMIEGALSSIPLSCKFAGDTMGLSYAMADQPTVLPEYGGRMAAGSVAEFFDAKEGPGHSPFKTSAMPKTTATSAPGPMLELFLDDFVFNTFSYAYVHSGNAHIQLDKNTVPEEAKPLFISGYYASAMPGLVEKYGMEADLRLDFDLQQVPTLYMQPDGFQFKSSAMLSLDVNTNTSYERAAGLNVDIISSGNIQIKGTSIFAEIKTLKVNVSVASSTIGKIDVDGLQQLIDFTVTYATSELNEKLAQGIPLPVVNGLAFVDPKITWGANYVAITSSFSYTPPSYKDI